MALRFGRTVNTVYMASAREVVNWLYGGQSAFSQQSSISELGMRRAHNMGSIHDVTEARPGSTRSRQWLEGRPTRATLRVTAPGSGWAVR